MEKPKIYNITESLPDNGEKCFCFGHKTFCCVDDMDQEPDWHEVVFSFCINSYTLKKQIPEDPEDSILESYTISEDWEILGQEDVSYGGREHVIGVTKWKKIHILNKSI